MVLARSRRLQITVGATVGKRVGAGVGADIGEEVGEEAKEDVGEGVGVRPWNQHCHKTLPSESVCLDDASWWAADVQ